ncbi:hypothetical protein STEG23_000494, partial [Scotinomys teguina]
FLFLFILSAHYPFSCLAIDHSALYQTNQVPLAVSVHNRKTQTSFQIDIVQMFINWYSIFQDYETYPVGIKLNLYQLDFYHVLYLNMLEQRRGNDHALLFGNGKSTNKRILKFVLKGEVDRHLGCFQVLAIMNNAAMDIVDHMSLRQHSGHEVKEIFRVPT